MVEKTTGIILRVLPLTETSVIVDWLTLDVGRISTAAKGARRSKSPFRGKLDLFFLAAFTFTRNRRSDLHALGELELLEPNVPLRQDLALLHQAAYAAKLIVQTTEKDTPVPEVFELLRDFLAEIVRGPARARNVFSFELKLLLQMGLRPDWRESAISDAAKQTLQQLMERDWAALDQLSVSRRQFEEITHYLHGFLIYHLGKVPEGRADAICA